MCECFGGGEESLGVLVVGRSGAMAGTGAAGVYGYAGGG